MRISDWSSDVCSSDLPSDESCPPSGPIACALSARVSRTRAVLAAKDHAIVTTRDRPSGSTSVTLKRTASDVHRTKLRSKNVVISLLGRVAISVSRSEERRVGKECVSTCRARCSTNHKKKKTTRSKQETNNYRNKRTQTN